MSKISFLTPTFIEQEINGETFKFFPASVKIALELRNVAKPILTAITTLYSPRDAFKKGLVEHMKNKDGEEVRREQIEPVAVTIEAYKTLLTQREKAFQTLIETLLDPRNLLLFTTLIVDSMRETYDRKTSITADLVSEFSSMDIGTGAAFVKALVRANASVFSPFVGKLPNLAEIVQRAPLDLPPDLIPAPTTGTS